MGRRQRIMHRRQQHAAAREVAGDQGADALPPDAVERRQRFVQQPQGAGPLSPTLVRVRLGTRSPTPMVMGELSCWAAVARRSGAYVATLAADFKHGGQFLLVMRTHRDDPQGAIGIGIGATIEGLGLHDLLEQFEIAPGVSPNAPIHFGGPVDSRRGFVLHSPEWSAKFTAGGEVPVPSGYACAGEGGNNRASASGILS
eukprot:gene5790-7842_t